MAKELTYKEVWDTLSNVDCSEHIEKKMNLSYLSWAWAYGTLMEHYADAQFTFQAFADSDGIMRDAMFYPDGSASVHVTVSIGNLARSMWLPVMDYKNNAIANPSARQISDAKMRCLVKCIAMFGLGHYIYAGEDLPVSDDKKDSSGSADATLEIEEKPQSDESVESKEDVVDDKFIEIVEAFIKDVKSVESLESFWKENAKEFKRMKEGQEATYNGLLESFAKIKSELTKEENKDG
tara:strand:- start:152 stop:862 length:711 start_codon:yes stop_codon:yes gene_type:complete